MTGQPKPLSHKQEQAVEALLSCATLKAAAEKVGVNEKTIRRWLQEETFVAAYRQARRQLVESAIGRLQQAAGKAVETLERNLTCDKPGSEIKAALGILGHATKAIELLDMVERIEELERLMQESRDDGPPKEPT